MPRLESCYIGTSGWGRYIGFRGGVDYYEERSGLNMVEIASSFKKLPAEIDVKIWSFRRLLWSALADWRSLERYQLDWRGRRLVERLAERLQPLGGRLRFIVLRVRPSIRPGEQLLERIGMLADSPLLRGRLAVEAPHWPSDVIRLLGEAGAYPASTSSPLGLRLHVAADGSLFLRLIGSKLWYTGGYTAEEIASIVDELSRLEGLRSLYAVASVGRESYQAARLLARTLLDRGVCPPLRLADGSPAPSIEG